MESFMLFSKSAQLLDYICRPTNLADWSIIVIGITLIW